MNILLHLQSGGLVAQLKAHQQAVRQLQQQLSASMGVARAQNAGGLGSIPINFRQQMAAGRLQQAQLRQQAVGIAQQLAGQGGGVGGGGRIAQALARAGGAGQFSSLTGLLGAAGPLGLALTALAAVVVLTIKAMQFANEELLSWRNTFWKSGAQQGGAQSLAGIASALGLEPGSVAAKAGGLPGGSAQFLQQIKTLLSIRDDRQAFFMARSLGLEDYLPLRDLSKKSQDSALKGSDFGYSKQDRQNEAEFMSEWGKLTQIIKKTFIEQMLPALRLATPAIQFLAENLKILGKVAQWITSRSGLNDLIKVMNWLENKKAKQEESIDKFSGAVDNFTKAVGYFGGITNDRAKGAYPQAWAWYGLQQSMMNDARFLGAFTN